ncbi:hypothetical protein GCM10009857_04510 [Agromyces soli]
MCSQPRCGTPCHCGRAYPVLDLDRCGPLGFQGCAIARQPRSLKAGGIVTVSLQRTFTPAFAEPANAGRYQRPEAKLEQALEPAP